MKGGLILTEPFLPGFTPVLQMIQNGVIRLLTYDEGTLVGIIFTLTAGNSKYIDIKRQIQTEFVIKLVVISNPRTTYSLPSLSRKYKATTTKEKFLNEARIQQNVWTQSILYGGEEFSPSVVNFALFNNANGKILLQMMMNKYIGYLDRDRPDFNIIPELILLLTTKPSYEIGVLVMPNILNTITLEKYDINQKSTMGKAYMKAYRNSIKNILRLYFFHKIISKDLHEDNILITVDALENSYILDFGYTDDAASIDLKYFKKSSEEYSSDSEEDSSDSEKEQKYQENLLTFNLLCDEMQRINELKEDDEEEYKYKEHEAFKLKLKIKQFVKNIIDGIFEYDHDNKEHMNWGYTTTWDSISYDVFCELCILKDKHDHHDGFNIHAHLLPNQIFNLMNHVDSYYFEIEAAIAAPPTAAIAAPPTAAIAAPTVFKKKTAAKSEVIPVKRGTKTASTRKKGGKKIKKTRRHNKSKKSKKFNKSK
jgi:hypothetical protein